jgi:dUTP pyrophosphatase
MIYIDIKRMNDDSIIPTKATEGSAGFDLYASKDMVIRKGHTEVCSTGLSMAVPEGYEAQVRSRSGSSSRGLVVANSPGTIDSDYRGEVGVLLYNRLSDYFVINKGDRIAQLVIQEVPNVIFQEVKELGDTERGSGGFGSTGH